MSQTSFLPYRLPGGYQPDPRFVVVRSAEAFERMYHELTARPALTYDFETSGLAWYQHARAVGIALGCAYEDGRIQNYYVPFRHRTGEPQLDIAIIGPAIKDLLERPTLKVGHHLKFDEHIALREGWSPAGPRYDTMIGAQFVDENRSLRLKDRAVADLCDPHAGYWEMQVDRHILALAKRCRLGVEAYKDKHGYEELPVDLCGTYACHDTEYTTRLWGLYEGKYRVSQCYPRVWQTEMDLIGVLVDMEEAGLPVDVHYLKRLRDRVESDRDALGKQIEHWLGSFRLRIASDEELRRYLTEVLRLPLTKLTKSKKLSVDREVLESFADKSPVLPLIMRWRDANKIATTYTQSILDRLDEHNVVHPDFQQVGTNTGRLACREPNLQNVVTDDDVRAKETSGKRLKEGGVDPWSVKRAYVVPNGKVRLYADYSQIELRVLAYYSGDSIMREVYLTGGDIHARTSLEVFGTEDDEMRRRAKVINFGLSYCMSAKGFARNAKVPVADAERYLARFFERYHGIAEYRPAFWDTCRRQGNQFVNLFGRPRRVWGLQSRDEYDRGRAERQAIGSLVQGTASELTKESLVRLYKWIKENQVPAQLRLTVHDEIQIDVDVQYVESVIPWVKYHMERYPEFAPIPILVDVKQSTTNWAEKH